MGTTMNIQLQKSSLYHHEKGQQIMTKVWSFDQQNEAHQKYRQLLKVMHVQQAFEIQIKWVHKQYIKQKNRWKVIVCFEYPKQSLKKHLVKRKQLRQFFIVKQIFDIMRLIGYCLYTYQKYICSHTDLLSNLFVINQRNNFIKLCHPHLIYQPCKIDNCRQIVNYQRVIEQIFEILLLQKMSKVQDKQIEKVNFFYSNYELNRFIEIITNPLTNIEQFIRESKFITNIMKKKRLQIDMKENQYCSQIFQTNHATMGSSFKSYLPTKLCQMNNQIAYSIVHQNQIDISYEDQLNSQEIERFGRQKYKSQVIDKNMANFQFIDRIKQNQQEQNEDFQHGNRQYIMHQSQLEIESKNNSDDTLKNNNGDDLVWVVQFYNEGRHRYEGFKRNGFKQGKGRYFYDEGVFYEGQWKDDQINGFGILYYKKNQIAYKGNWKNGQFNGQGILMNKFIQPIEGSFDYQDFSDVGLRWKQFQGNFKDDDKNGKGILLLSNNQRFKCTWVSNAAEGYGQFENIQGDLIVGLWSNNKFCQSLKLSSCSSSNESRQHYSPFYS